MSTESVANACSIESSIIKEALDFDGVSNAVDCSRDVPRLGLITVVDPITVALSDDVAVSKPTPVGDILVDREELSPTNESSVEESGVLIESVRIESSETDVC
jgi:hypothetical protein